MKYPSLLSQWEILTAIKSGKYRVCTTSGNVYNGRGRIITPFTTHGRVWVRLYFRRKRKAIGVSRLLWMQETGDIIPANFEVHHMDQDETNNSWENLLCIHKSDHRKLHNGSEVNGDEMIPF